MRIKIKHNLMNNLFGRSGYSHLMRAKIKKNFGALASHKAYRSVDRSKANTTTQAETSINAIAELATSIGGTSALDHYQARMMKIFEGAEEGKGGEIKVEENSFSKREDNTVHQESMLRSKRSINHTKDNHPSGMPTNEASSQPCFWKDYQAGDFRQTLFSQRQAISGA
jgi:hypothetical protein